MTAPRAPHRRANGPEAPPLAGLVLCGGAGTRMGRDKAMIEVQGSPLVLRLASLLERIAEPVLLAPGQPGRLGALGYPEVSDQPGGIGPLGGLIAGLDRSPHDLVAVVAVDMPFASVELLALLAGLLGNQDAAVPVTDDGLQPLHAVYARSSLPGLRRAAAQGRWSVQEALEDLSMRTVPQQEWGSADPSGRFAFNLNRPEDLPGLF